MHSEDNERLHEAEFTCRMNIIYEDLSINIYRGFVSVTTLVSIVFPSTAIASAFDVMPVPLQPYKGPTIGILSLITAILNAVVLAFKVSDKEISHTNIRTEWFKVLDQASRLRMLATKGSTIEDALLELEYEMNKIHGKGPPNYRRLKKAYLRACLQMGLESDESSLRMGKTK
jgi:hypothetical protein